MAIYDERALIKNRVEINKYFMKNFEEVFTTENPCILETLGELGLQSMSNEENAFFMGIPSEEEIKASISTFHPLKALGPNGFFGIFFRHY